MVPPRPRQVTPQDIRERFNALDYVGRAAAGELQAEIELDLPLPDWKCRKYGLPSGSRSQRVAYYDGPTLLARAHQFVRPDGSIGASGKPDPKELLVGDELWFV